MMSEKRFEIIGGTIWVCNGEYEEELWNPQIVQILNKQQATITALKEENEQLKSELHMRKMSATIDLMSRRSM